MTLSEAQRRGIRLVVARKLKGLRQVPAAKEIGVSRTTLSGWENGEPIDEAWIEAIVRVYGGSKGWIRYGEGAPPKGYIDEPEVVLMSPGPLPPREPGEPLVAKRRRQGKTG